MRLYRADCVSKNLGQAGEAFFHHHGRPCSKVSAGRLVRSDERTGVRRVSIATWAASLTSGAQVEREGEAEC